MVSLTTRIGYELRDSRPFHAMFAAILAHKTRSPSPHSTPARSRPNVVQNPAMRRVLLHPARHKAQRRMHQQQRGRHHFDGCAVAYLALLVFHTKSQSFHPSRSSPRGPLISTPVLEPLLIELMWPDTSEAPGIYMDGGGTFGFTC